MNFILASVVLFSFVHPGSKMIIDGGLPLSFFCTLFVGLRVVAIMPVFIYKKTLPVPQKKNLPILFLFGLTGASLQFFEFKGISKGLPPGLVTFLMFSYPLWLYILKVFKEKKIDLVQSVQFSLLLLGLFFLTGGSFNEMKNYAVIYPILASLAVAVWIVLSNKLTKKGIEPFSLSLYYDFFSLMALLILFGRELVAETPQFLVWLSGKGFLSLVSYSVLIGLVPNILFYYGSKKVTSDAAGGVMTLEPVISTLYSFMLWGVVLSSGFWLGSALVFIGNLPMENLLKKIKKEMPGNFYQYLKVFMFEKELRRKRL